MLRSLLVLLLLLSARLACAAELSTDELNNWAQWRGPWQNGASLSANPPTEWSEEKNIKWKVEIPGEGSSTPAVWNDRVFILTAEAMESGQEDVQGQPEKDRPRGTKSGASGKQKFILMCLDRATGKTLWQKPPAEAVPHEAGHQTNTFASASPLTNGKLVYAHFGTRGLFCYDVEGNFKWKKEFGIMKTRNNFGEGSTPALYGNTLVVPWDQETGSYLSALNAQTGEPIWRQDREERTTWASPLIVEHKGRVQVIAHGIKRVRSYDLATGENIWECGGQADNPIATPVAADGMVYCMTGYKGFMAMAIPLDAQGDITGTEKIIWKYKDAGPYVPSPVLYGGQLYFIKENNGVYASLDAKTGEVIIPPTRLSEIRTIYSSPVAAKDKIYFTGRDGTTVVIEHGREGKVLATNQLNDTIDSSAVLLGKEIFLRGAKKLYCISEQ